MDINDWLFDFIFYGKYEYCYIKKWKICDIGQAAILHNGLRIDWNKGESTFLTYN